MSLLDFPFTNIQIRTVYTLYHTLHTYLHVSPLCGALKCCKCPGFYNFSIPHSHCPVPRSISSPLSGVPIGCVTCNVHIVGQTVVIWNIQQFDTHPVLCELDEGNFFVFCAAQKTRPAHLPVYLLNFFL